MAKRPRATRAPSRYVKSHRLAKAARRAAETAAEQAAAKAAKQTAKARKQARNKAAKQQASAARLSAMNKARASGTASRKRARSARHRQVARPRESVPGVVRVRARRVGESYWGGSKDRKWRSPKPVSEALMAFLKDGQSYGRRRSKVYAHGSAEVEGTVT